MSGVHSSMLDAVAAALEPVDVSVVFVGGATVHLYLPERVQNVVRATKDVDCVVEVTSNYDYFSLEQRLRRCGFRNDKDENAIRCRWHVKDMVVDIMPVDPKILGFSNPWYGPGVAAAIDHRLPSGRVIQIFPLRYAFAAKIAAFEGRGRGDPLESSDLEDLIAILDGCGQELQTAMRSVDPGDPLRSVVREWSRSLVSERYIDEWIEGMLSRPVTPARVNGVRAHLDWFAGEL